MVVKGWNNGGSTFGIKIGVADRAAFFDRSWKQIVLVIDDVGHEISLTDAFWAKCSELRSPAIRDWLGRHGKLVWPSGNPPRFTLEPLGGARFRLV